MFSFFRKIDPKAAAMVQYMETHPTGDIFGDTSRTVFFEGFHLGFSCGSEGETRSIFLNRSNPETCDVIFDIYNNKKEVKALDKARRKALTRYHNHIQEKVKAKRQEALDSIEVLGITQ
ncbi:hypothetical protein F485_gp258 [Aeromonas phage CC2]|uniref:Uncharacterized protein n=1 Tax=Aeromonas phage CC2 TaxID=1204516 RepID=I6WLU6_9CAUD|nr:hypothetical protein F485_gp258 [Aeromonas phage CC2]AFN39183.1 hypothetical protein CC2_037 [Aeromonas phage CC2]